MNISPFTNFAYNKAQYRPNARAMGDGSSIIDAWNGAVDSASSSTGGNHHINLRLGYLYSSGNPTTGQEMHMKYDESSTEDDPVMLVQGKDIEGKDFVKKIHLNDVDVNNASIVEMTALNVHLAKQGDESAKSHVSIPLQTMGSHYDVNHKMNFQTILQQWAESLANGGFHQDANKYKSELERYLFFEKNAQNKL